MLLLYGVEQKSVSSENSTSTTKSSSSGKNYKRRVAHYKPNIWSYDFVESLTDHNHHQSMNIEGRLGKLKDDLMNTFTSVETKVELVEKLGLLNLLRELELDLSLQLESSDDRDMISCFRRSVPWFEVRNQIDEHDNMNITTTKDVMLVALAKLNFNTVQAIHQKDLKDLGRWWKNLGIIENMISFTRDRLVESFLWTVGVAYEPRHSCLRKCLTKVITFILVIDDLYDVFGFLDELECFTRIVERWDPEEIYLLPECMKICFQGLYDTMNDIAQVIHEETGQSGVLPHLIKAWADFCKALLEEARWYYAGYTPSLDEYLSSAWISSSGPLLSLIVYLFSANRPLLLLSSNELIMKERSSSSSSWEEMQDLVYYISLIVRLCNDLGTSRAELERGDTPSSILCYMKEAKVTEDKSEQKIRDMIDSSWVKIHEELLRRIGSTTRTTTTSSNDHVQLVINIARVTHFIYSKGDGIGVQDSHTRNQINRILLEPFALDRIYN